MERSYLANLNSPKFVSKAANERESKSPDMSRKEFSKELD